jgi:hypothetical protein
VIGGGVVPAHAKTSWVTVLGSSGDAPELRYGSLFMLACNSGRHFGLTFSRKPYVYTTELSYGLMDERDFKNLKPANPYISYLYMEALVQGKSLPEIVTFLNQVRTFKNSTSPDHFAVSQ